MRDSPPTTSLHSLGNPYGTGLSTAPVENFADPGSSYIYAPSLRPILERQPFR